MSKVFKCGAVTVVLVMLAGSASAEVLQCRNCTSAMMENYARNLGRGTYVVWNPVNAAIEKYEVSCGIQNGAEPASSVASRANDDATQRSAANCRALSLPVPENYVDVAGKLLELSQQTHGTYKALVSVNADHWMFPGHTGSSPTAHDYVTDANYRSQLNDKLGAEGLNYANEAYVATILRFLMAHVDAALSFTDAVEITIDLEFSDDSKAQVKLKLDASATYVDGSARDATGQLIPDENAASNAGVWKYYGGQEASRDRMYDTMNKLGFIMGVRPNRYTTMTCTWQPGVNRITCSLTN